MLQLNMIVPEIPNIRESGRREGGRFPVSNQLRSLSNTSRHKRRCKEKHGVNGEEPEEEDDGRDTATIRTGRKKDRGA